MPLLLLQRLLLDNCPYCGVERPCLSLNYNFETTNRHGVFKRKWGVFTCKDCGGLVTASALKLGGKVFEVYPSTEALDDSIPAKAKEMLSQAVSSLGAPAGSTMLAAAAVDVMLKRRKCVKGNLYDRLDQAVRGHMVPMEMVGWARDLRLDINDQNAHDETDDLSELDLDEEDAKLPAKSHVDPTLDLPTKERAEKCIEFARTLAEFLFVLPARVKHGSKVAKRG